MADVAFPGWVGGRSGAKSVPGRGLWYGAFSLYAIVGVLTAAYVAGFVVPYYVNDLDALPLAEVSTGLHDPKDLWPYVGGGAGWVLVRLAAMLSVLVVPLAVLGLAGHGIWGAVSASTTRRRARWTVAVASGAVALGIVGWFVSPLGTAITLWALD